MEKEIKEEMKEEVKETVEEEKKEETKEEIKDNRKKIVIIRAQESVVTRGIQKKLMDFDCNIVSVGEKVAEVEGAIRDASLVIFYLGQSYDDHSSDRVVLEKILDLFSENGMRVILIGEESQLEDLAKLSFVVSSYIWLERPVDMDKLQTEVEQILESDDDELYGEKKILMIDDDNMYGKVVCEWMKDYFDINYVSTGVQAISYLSDNKVDLILLDYEMPIADGPQVLEMIRNQPETADIPVIFLTSVNSKEQVERVLSLKPLGYVLKNIAKADLIQYLMGIFEKLDGKGRP